MEILVKFPDAFRDQDEVRKATELAKQIAVAVDEATLKVRREERDTMRRALEVIDSAEEKLRGIAECRTIAEHRDLAEAALASVNVAGAILSGARVQIPMRRVDPAELTGPRTA